MSYLPRDILQQVRRIHLRTSRLVDDVLAGAYHSTFKGRGMEFDEVREYTPGDEVRSIDWNVTARRGQPYVKRYVEERELTVMLLVDLSASGQFGSVLRLKTDIATELCAVLAWSRYRFVRFASDQRRETTLHCLAECFEELGGVPAKVLADRMGCLTGGTVANVVVPNAEYVRFATHFGFQPDFCEAADPESKGVVEALVRYAKQDLVVPADGWARCIWGRCPSPDRSGCRIS